MFAYLQTQPFTINKRSYASGQTSAPAGCVLISAGFQNYGESTKVYASQQFITSGGGGVYSQIVNPSGSTVQCVIWVVVYYEGGVALTDEKLSIEGLTITPLPSTEEE